MGALIAPAIVWTDLRNHQQRARRGLPNRSAALQFAFTVVTLALVLAFILSSPDPRSGLARGMPVPVLIMLAVTSSPTAATRRPRARPGSTPPD